MLRPSVLLDPVLLHLLNLGGIEKKARAHGRELRQDWAGALKDYKDKYTSLELQKKALEWRGD